MNKKRLLLILLSLGLCLALVLSTPVQKALAFGDFDSGSDFGGDSGGGDWDYGSDSGDGTRISGPWSVVVWIFAGIMMLLGIGWTSFILFMSFSVKSDTKTLPSNSLPGEQPADRREAFLQLDPEFNETELLEYVKKLFTEMQETWEAGDIGPVRYGFVPDTWNRFNTQLQMKNSRGETTHVRDIAFVETGIADFGIIAEKDRLTVRILVDYNVWITNRKGRNIQGSPSTRHRMDYRWIMVRPAGTKTGAAGMVDRKHCPNCGAELDVAAFAECPFCKAQIGGEWQGWLLSDIQAVSQKTLHV